MDGVIVLMGSPRMSILLVFSGGFGQFLPVKTVYLVSGAGFNRGRGIGRNYHILWRSWKEPALLCGAGSGGVGYVMSVGLGSGYFADAGWV